MNYDKYNYYTNIYVNLIKIVTTERITMLRILSDICSTETKLIFTHLNVYLASEYSFNVHAWAEIEYVKL